MEQWNSNSDDYLKALKELEREVILMNYELTDLEAPTEFGKFEKNPRMKDEKSKIAFSLDIWAKYQFLLHLYEGIPEDEKEETVSELLLECDGENFKELRKQLAEKSCSSNDFSQFNRKIKKQLNSIIYYILSNYGENFKEEEMYYIVSGVEDAKKKSMNGYDWVFWGYLYENRKRAKALIQKKISNVDMTEDDEKLLSIIHINFSRLAKKKKSKIEKTKFDEMWKKNFYEEYLKKKENIVMSYLEKLKMLILEKAKDEEYLDFLDIALGKLKNCYEEIDKKYNKNEL